MKYITDDGAQFSTLPEARAHERQARRKEGAARLISYLERNLPGADTVAITEAILRDIKGFVEAVEPLVRKRAPRSDRGMPNARRGQRAGNGAPRTDNGAPRAGKRKGKNAPGPGGQPPSPAS